MQISENRRLAWAVLAACVLMSVFGLGGGALSRERGQVMKVFNEGVDTTLSTRHSMDAYLDGASAAASVMANEVEARVGGSAAVDAALESAKLVGDDTATLDARYSAYDALKGQVEKLYNSLYGAVDEAAFRDFKLAYDDFWGYADMLKRDEYHAQAKDYNDLISGFPGGVVATVTRQGELNTFGG